jgi:hypothetical protein
MVLNLPLDECIDNTHTKVTREKRKRKGRKEKKKRNERKTHASDQKPNKSQEKIA